ncbi:MAG: hypothetical protein ABEK04_01865 [Candidatus Nanohalobium sp.]
MSLLVGEEGNLYNTSFKPLHLEDNYEQNRSLRPGTDRKCTQKASRRKRSEEVRDSPTSSYRIPRGVKKMSKYRDIIQDELEQLESQENHEENADAATQAAQA